MPSATSTPASHGAIETRDAGGVRAPLRVLHVVGQMNRGGIETWLMHVLRRLDRDRLALDLLAITAEPGHYDGEARTLGAKVIRCVGHTRPWTFVRNLLRILVEEGPYDVVHSHVGYFSGLVMFAARKAGVPVRIVHSHNTLHGPPVRSAARAAYEGAAALLIRRYATAGLAVSEPAAEPLFGNRWRADRRWQVVHLGIDLAPFDPLADRAPLRVALGLPPDAPVVGHVGRFAPQKNHDFLIDIFAGVAAQRPDARLLLVGDGPLRPTIERKVASLGLGDRVVFAGIRSDVPALLYAMDLLIMPSHHEGLALALLEGQAAGVPMIIASNMAEEGSVVERLIARASVSEPAAQWADRALAALEQPPGRESRLSALQCMRESAFNIDVAMPRLLAMYEALAKRA